MNSKSRSIRFWMSMLIRLVLVSSFLMMMASTAVSLANPSADSHKILAPTISSVQGQSHQGHDIRLGLVKPERQAASSLSESRSLKRFDGTLSV